MQRIFNELQTPFLIYNAIQKQSHRRQACCGTTYRELVSSIIMPVGALLPFQMRSDTAFGTLTVGVYDFFTDAFVADISGMFTGLNTVTPTFGSVFYWVYNGSGDPNLPCGTYYLVISNSLAEVIAYSDVFRVLGGACCFNRLEWWNACTVDENGIYYGDGAGVFFKNVLYFDACEFEPDPEVVIVQEVKRDGGRLISESDVQDWFITSLGTFYAPIKRAIVAMNAHNYIRLYRNNGEIADILAVDISFEEVRVRCDFEALLRFRQGNVYDSDGCCVSINGNPAAHGLPALTYVDCETVAGCPTPSFLTVVGSEFTDPDFEVELTWLSGLGQSSFEILLDGIVVESGIGNTATIDVPADCGEHEICVRHVCDIDGDEVVGATDCITFTSPAIQCSPPTIAIDDIVIDGMTLQITNYDALFDYEAQLLPIIGIANWSTNGLPPFTVSAEFTPISGLLPCQQYLIRVRKVCNDGLGLCPQYSNYATLGFATSCCPLDFDIVITAGDCEDTDSAVTISLLNNTPPYVIYALDGVTIVLQSNDAPLVGALPVGTYTILGISGGCEFEQLLTIADPCVCAPPQYLGTYAISAISASLWWSLVASAVSYEMRWRAVGSGVWITASVPTNGYLLAGLARCRAYEFQVRSDCGDVLSDWSAFGVFSTLGCANCDTPCEATFAPSFEFVLPPQFLLTLNGAGLSGAATVELYYSIPLALGVTPLTAPFDANLSNAGFWTDAGGGAYVDSGYNFNVADGDPSYWLALSITDGDCAYVLLFFIGQEYLCTDALHSIYYAMFVGTAPLNPALLLALSVDTSIICDCANLEGTSFLCNVVADTLCFTASDSGTYASTIDTNVFEYSLDNGATWIVDDEACIDDTECLHEVSTAAIGHATDITLTVTNVGTIFTVDAALTTPLSGGDVTTIQDAYDNCTGGLFMVDIAGYKVYTMKGVAGNSFFVSTTNITIETDMALYAALCGIFGYEFNPERYADWVLNSPVSIIGNSINGVGCYVYSILFRHTVTFTDLCPALIGNYAITKIHGCGCYTVTNLDTLAVSTVTADCPECIDGFGFINVVIGECIVDTVIYSFQVNTAVGNVRVYINGVFETWATNGTIISKSVIGAGQTVTLLMTNDEFGCSDSVLVSIPDCGALCACEIINNVAIASAAEECCVGSFSFELVQDPECGLDIDDLVIYKDTLLGNILVYPTSILPCGAATVGVVTNIDGNLVFTVSGLDKGIYLIAFFNPADPLEVLCSDTIPIECDTCLFSATIDEVVAATGAGVNNGRFTFTLTDPDGCCGTIVEGDLLRLGGAGCILNSTAPTGFLCNVQRAAWLGAGGVIANGGIGTWDILKLNPASYVFTVYRGGCLAMIFTFDIADGSAATCLVNIVRFPEYIDGGVIVYGVNLPPFPYLSQFGFGINYLPGAGTFIVELDNGGGYVDITASCTLNNYAANLWTILIPYGLLPVGGYTVRVSDSVTGACNDLRAFTIY